MQHQLFLSMTTLRVTALDLRLTTISHNPFFTWFAGLYEFDRNKGSRSMAVEVFSS